MMLSKGDSMTLKEYLEETKIGNNTFARISGVDPAVISRLARGIQTGLRLETAEAIVRASGGLISFEDLCSQHTESDDIPKKE